MKKWAVGLKGWVEVRSASTRPHRHLTYLPVTTTEDVQEAAGMDAWGYMRYRTRRKEVTKKVKMIAFSGGKVVETLTNAAFRRKYGFGCPHGSCIDIGKAVPEVYNNEIETF